MAYLTRGFTGTGSRSFAGQLSDRAEHRSLQAQVAPGWAAERLRLQARRAAFW